MEWETTSVRHPYFEDAGPTRYDTEYSYAGEGKLTHTAQYEWAHGLGEIITALIQAGLRIQRVDEHRFLDWQGMPCMVRGEDGYYRMPNHIAKNIPLQFSILAVKE